MHAGGTDAKLQQSVLDSGSEGSVDGDDMPETEDDGEEANLDISDERKRLQAVLAHFDGGEAAALQGKAQQAAMVSPCGVQASFVRHQHPDLRSQPV